MNRQRSPAAARFNHSLSRPKLNFAADVVQLCLLRFFERSVGRREVRARINQSGIEPELVKIVRQIIVMMDVARRAFPRIGLPPVLPAFPRSAVQACRPGARPRVKKVFEEADQISADTYRPRRVAIAEANFGV